MKKYLILLLAVTSLTVLASCEKDNGVSDTNPRISINEKETALPPTGGTASIGYEIINPVENGELKAEPTVSWMSGFKVSETRISFAVEANSTGSSRPGIIKLTYTYGDSLSTTLDVNVTQETMQEGDVATPIIEFDEDPVNLPAQEGKGEITYSVLNPVTGARISAELDAPCDWLTEINYDTEGIITFDVAPNYSTESRSAVMNINYTYGDQSIFNQVEVIQAGVNTYEAEINYMWITSTGIYNSNTRSYEFMLKLSSMPISENGDLTDGATSYVLDLYSSEDGSTPAAGTYNVDMNNTAETGTIGYYLSCAILEGKSTPFTLISGSITISYEGDNISISGTLTDADYSIHTISYTGILEEEEEEGISCFTDDYTLDLTNVTVTYDYLPDDIFIPRYIFEFVPNSDGDGIYIELYARAENGATLPTGTFNEEPQVPMSSGFYPGSVANGYPRGTMYYKYKNGGKSGDYAPAITGELTIADNGDETYTFTFAFVDDKGYTWSGEWTGTVWEAY